MDVVDNQQARRFELAVDGAVAIADYRIHGDRIAFIHTGVPPELEGRGIGKTLIAAALDSARARGLKVVPTCKFVRHYIDSHPETADLLA